MLTFIVEKLNDDPKLDKHMPDSNDVTQDV